MEYSEKSKKYFVIDICGTIFRSNTTMDFFEYFYSNETWYKRINRVKNNRFLAVLCYLVQKYTHYDFIRFQMVKHLKGISNEKLAEMFNEFYHEFLVNKTNPQVIDVIEQYRSKGAELIAVSATLDGIANVVARNLNIPHILSSELDYNNGVCTGKYRCELLGKKVDALKAIGVTSIYHGVITDNYSDLELIKKSHDKWVVINDYTEPHWRKMLCGISDIHIIKTAVR